MIIIIIIVLLLHQYFVVIQLLDSRENGISWQCTQGMCTKSQQRVILEFYKKPCGDSWYAISIHASNSRHIFLPVYKHPQISVQKDQKDKTTAILERKCLVL